MRCKMKCLGLALGTVMIVTVMGTGTAFAATQSTKAKTQTEKKAGETSNGKGGVESDDKSIKEKKAADNNSNLFYGRINKVDNGKIIIDGAAVVWEKSSESSGNDNSGKTVEEWPVEESDDIAADIETEFMKWKLDGSLVEVVTDKDTRFIKKPGNPSENNSSVDENAQKEEKAGKTKKESKEKNNSKENSEEITLQRQDALPDSAPDRG